MLHGESNVNMDMVHRHTLQIGYAYYARQRQLHDRSILLHMLVVRYLALTSKNILMPAVRGVYSNVHI